MLVELGLVEQRYGAVCEVLDGATVVDMARRNGVPRADCSAALPSGRSAALVAFRQAHGGGDSSDHVRAEASMTAERDDTRDAAVVRPSVDRLRGDTKDPGSFSRGEVRLIG